MFSKHFQAPLCPGIVHVALPLAALPLLVHIPESGAHVLCCITFGVQAKKVNDEREAAENARIAADVAAADKRAQEEAEKLAEKRRKMQQDCDKASSLHMPQPSPALCLPSLPPIL